MECDVIRNGADIKTTGTARSAGVKRKLNGGVGGVRLGLPAELHGAAAALSLPPPPAPPRQRPDPHPAPHTDPPFMNNMDEISYWIFTKRAPCLMNYDILNKKQVLPIPNDAKIENLRSSGDESTPKKRKKRKLSILDDVSVAGKQQNVFFESPQPAHKPAASSKSSTLVSDIDFNIKNSSIQEKTKRSKTQKNCLTTLHKKNKVVTSTPKVNSALRRSLRKQNCVNDKSPPKAVYHTNFVFVNNDKLNVSENIKKCNQGPGKKVVCNLNKRFDSNETNPKTVLNGQLEDMSDVSGFTANYIRSTKIQNTKTPKNLRSKNNRNLVKESQQNIKIDDDKTIVCVSKAINTKDPTSTPVLNLSTDSSQNVLNLITVHEQEKGNRINKSTSLLKFMDSKTNKNSKGKLEENSTSKNNSKLDISFDSTTSSRYPLRYRNGSRGDITGNTTESKPTSVHCSPTKGRVKINKRPSLVLDMKEDPESSLSRTRSGRSVGVALHRPADSVLVLSHSTEPSSKHTMNVARPDPTSDNGHRKKRNSGVRFINHSKKSMEKNHSLRDRSGFAACFSDLEDTDEPSNTRKFFC